MTLPQVGYELGDIEPFAELMSFLHGWTSTVTQNFSFFFLIILKLVVVLWAGILETQGYLLNSNNILNIVLSACLWDSLMRSACKHDFSTSSAAESYVCLGTSVAKPDFNMVCVGNLCWQKFFFATSPLSIVEMSHIGFCYWDFITAC